MLRSVLRLLSVRDKLALAGLVRGMSGQVQLGCVSALHRSGALFHLREWKTVEEVAAATPLVEADLLQSLMDLASKRRVLKKRGMSYRARSALARRIAADPSGPLASMVEEVTTYHLDVLRQLPARLSGAPPVDYLDQFGPVVASSSRIMDHWLLHWLDRLLASRTVRSVLDLGCGSGAVLGYIGSRATDITGLGIDLDENVVANARKLIEERGLNDRFEIRAGDMRDLRILPQPSYDLITANQNVYYFDADARAAVWNGIRQRLSEGGCLSVVSPMAGGPMSDYFDLILGSTAGCSRLPTVEQVERELATSNLKVVHRERLIPGDSVYGLTAEAVRS